MEFEILVERVADVMEDEDATPEQMIRAIRAAWPHVCAERERRGQAALDSAERRPEPLRPIVGHLTAVSVRPPLVLDEDA